MCSNSSCRYLMGGCAVLAALVISAQSAMGNINLELRPTVPVGCSDDTIEIGLYAVPDDGTSQPMRNTFVIFVWDEDVLELTGKIDNGPVQWFLSFFPDDSNLDGLNQPFTGPEPFVPDNDGDAVYASFGPFTPNPPVMVPSEGLLVTTFTFRVIGEGEGGITILSQVPGGWGHTSVIGAEAGEEVVGTLGSATVMACDQQDPVVLGTAPRTVRLTVCPCSAPAVPVALKLEGDSSDSSVECVSGYVQPDGTLDSEPVYQLPSAWGEGVYAMGVEFVPDSRWNVVTEQEGGTVSSPQSFTLSVWGDVTGEGVADVDDLLWLLDGFAGVFENAPLEEIDLAPCDPIPGFRVVDVDDVSAGLSAFSGALYTDLCEFPCP